MNSSQLIGNEALKTHLENAAKRDAFGHAYILHGPRGSGKRTLAGFLSAAILCSSQSGRPCFRCSHCRKVQKGIHPDVVTVDAGGKEIGVGQIRELRKDAYIRPNEAAKKIYILPAGETMNFAAQNAMLKLLEEGPSHAVFLILTETPEALLPTVRSRCVELGLSPLTAEEMEPLLRERFPEKSSEELRLAARRSGGAAGRALELLEGNPDTGELPQAFAEILSRKSEWDLLSFCVGQEKTDRDTLGTFLENCEAMLTESLRVKMAGGEDGEFGGAAALLARSLTKSEIAGTIDILRRLGGYCRNNNAGTGHVLGMLAAGCWEMIH